MRSAFHQRKRSCALRGDISSHQQRACRECAWEGTGEQSRSHRVLSLSCREGVRHLFVLLPPHPPPHFLPHAQWARHTAPHQWCFSKPCVVCRCLRFPLRLQTPAQRLEVGKPVVWLCLLPKDSIHGPELSACSHQCLESR